MADQKDRDDDEMDLINAEFESMVAGLNLDQSSPRTYLDELEEFEKSEKSSIELPPRIKRGIHGSFQYLLTAIRSWWNKPPRDDSDGAVV